MRLVSMGASELQTKVDHDPTATVMEPTYDNVFEPWPREKLRTCIDQIASAVKSGKTSVELSSLVQSDAVLSKFTELHPRIYEKICKKEFVENQRYMCVLYEMLDLQNDIRNGGISDTDAKTAVSDIALGAVHSSGSGADGECENVSQST
tara:strand:+ start:2800 stop:3249 length:450 start_codon:yes stop_codon:yes gene_type:complete